MKFEATTKKNILIQAILISILLIAYNLNTYIGFYLSLFMILDYGIILLVKYRKNRKGIFKKLFKVLLAIIIAQILFVSTCIYNHMFNDFQERSRIDKMITDKGNILLEKNILSEGNSFYLTKPYTIKGNLLPIGKPYTTIRVNTFAVLLILSVYIVIFALWRPRKNKKILDIFLFIISLITTTIVFSGTILQAIFTGITLAKPVIYLYPEKKEKVKVKLRLKGELKTTYPEYNKEVEGWQVVASPDGTIIDESNGRKYQSIFWDGISKGINIDCKKGFVIKGSDTEEFLYKTLTNIGLNNKEINEFIVYWLPLMEKNQYNYISFLKEEYTECAKLDIYPKPDSILRVFMVFKKLNNRAATKLSEKIEPVEFEGFKRNGFTVVEWGGSEIQFLNNSIFSVNK